jgi:steroid delta-isomerase-like uncharacterized protein
MSEGKSNKQTIQNLIQTVWHGQDLVALKDFWTEDCINHAMPGTDNQGLDVLRDYHESFFQTFFTAFSNVQIKILKQVAEDDQLATYMTTQGTHSGPFFGMPPSGKTVSMPSMRIDRFQDGKIAEHWSVADMAGLMQQLQS